MDRLLSEKQTVTIEAICRTSTELDLEGWGVKKSSILENQEAYAYYREHSISYRVAQGRKCRTASKGNRQQCQHNRCGLTSNAMWSGRAIAIYK